MSDLRIVFSERHKGIKHSRVTIFCSPDIAETVQNDLMEKYGLDMLVGGRSTEDPQKAIVKFTLTDPAMILKLRNGIFGALVKPSTLQIVNGK